MDEIDRDYINFLEERVLLLELQTHIQKVIAECETAINERGIMPNRTVFTDDKTTTAVMKALAGKGDLDIDQVVSALERMQAAGIQFGTEIEARKIGPRKKNADGTDSDETEVPQPQLAQENQSVF